MSKLILHLCADIGSDSQPYREAGYEVICIGKDIGVEGYIPPPGVYGIIANPPCTMFSIARTKAKKPRDLNEGMRLVKECLRIIWECQARIETEHQRHSPLKFWALENPATGYLRWFLGKPAFEYCPSEYGADFTKKTALWGQFNEPKKPWSLRHPLKNRSIAGHMYTLPGKKAAKNHEENMHLRSMIYGPFAKAFFEANP